MVIGHSVWLNTDVSRSGNLTVNSGGQLYSTASGANSRKNLSMTGGTLSVSGTLLVENLTVAAGASTQVQSGGLVTVRRDYTNSGYLAVWGGLVVERTFTNLATGDVDVYGNMQVDANLDNTGGNFEVHTTGDLTVNGSINNSGGTFTNSGHVYVDANLRNNPGGVLNGSGAWDVNINTINTAGGIITGGLDFCDYDVFNQCLLDNACVSLACSLSCQSTANPLVGGGGGVIDSASLMVCGIAICGTEWYQSHSAKW
ncbi:MAG: hypothetical protein ACK51A_02905 [Sphingobacteriia bacterium]